MLIDTHCHLDFPDFSSDRDAVIKEAHACGIDYIINIGSSLKGSEDSVKLAQDYESIFATVGCHPHEADKITKSDLDALARIAQSRKVVAIGEVGLDYFKSYSKKENQIPLFESLVELALKMGLPLVIHCRLAQQDTLAILKRFSVVRAVIHCFSGDRDFLRQCLDLGFMVSFTCNITYPKAEGLRQLVKFTPLDRLFLETDAPFLPPDGMRGRRNEPKQVAFLAEVIAQLKGIKSEEVARVTTDSAFRFFSLQ